MPRSHVTMFSRRDREPGAVSGRGSGTPPHHSAPPVVIAVRAIVTTISPVSLTPAIITTIATSVAATAVVTPSAGSSSVTGEAASPAPSLQTDVHRTVFPLAIVIADLEGHAVTFSNASFTIEQS
uniref:Uncharacterized protein n=1 Tax=Noctiluca scintillans TaxID=2966 RepID=A0A7S1AD93_NOCSC